MSDTAPPDLDILRALTEAGWAFYRNPARQRADDQLVRGLAGDGLGRAGAAVAVAEARARGAIAAPTRENPLPDARQLASARALRALRERIAAVETRLRGAAAAPDRDATTQILSESQCDALVALDAALLAAVARLAQAPDEPALAGLEGLLARRAALIAWR
jgi:hypothetical protein